MNTSLGFWRNPVVHTIVVFLVFVLPVIFIAEPTWANITLSSLVTGVIGYLKDKSLVAGIKAGSIQIK